jgi:predicted ATP-dependent endonuclease of OLD family
MFDSLKIENFRGFRSFELSKLGKINLLVGANNSGKSSILEAIHLICAKNNISHLLEILDYRSEFSWIEDREFRQISLDSPIKTLTKEFSVAHLFYGHTLDYNNSFSITGLRKENKDVLTVSLREHNIDQSTEVNYHKRDIFSNIGDIDLILKWDGENNIQLPLSINGGIFPQDIPRHFGISSRSEIKNQFVTPGGTGVDKLIEIFNEINLTPRENIVLDALKIIDPNIERIAIKTNSNERGKRGGFKLLLSGYQEPIPIGSMGDGIWRMLTIALAMVNCQGGIVLLDEIDSGLHFTTMLKMWELIWETAKKLTVQVFATTHNSDCLLSLADFINCGIIDLDEGKDSITLHRIESDKPKSIFLNAKEISIAAQRGIEVR